MDVSIPRICTIVKAKFGTSTLFNTAAAASPSFSGVAKVFHFTRDPEAAETLNFKQ